MIDLEQLFYLVSIVSLFSGAAFTLGYKLGKLQRR